MNFELKEHSWPEDRSLKDQALAFCISSIFLRIFATAMQKPGCWPPTI
jgi:hypothetical protein